MRLVLLPLAMPLASAAFLAAAFIASGQAPPTPSFGERVEVSIINLEVFVTDEAGEAVRGLTPADFTLLEDGKPLEITNFSAFEGGASARIAGAGEVREDAAPAPPPPPPQLTYVLYIDNANLIPANRKRALRQLATFLQGEVRPESQVMIATFEQGVAVRLAATRDLTAVLAKLKELEKGGGEGIATRNTHRLALSQIQALYDDGGCREEVVDQMKALTVGVLRSQHDESQRGLLGLRQFVDALAGMPGRKALFHLSDGISLVTGQDLVLLVNELCPGTFDTFFDQQFNNANLLRQVTTHANAASVTFYTMESLGLRPPSSSSVESARPLSRPALELAATANAQDVLFNLASETGGQALLNTNKLDEALVKVGLDLENFYSLAYSSPRQGDGRVHHIEVRVNRPGAKVRHRGSYRDKTPAERTEERVLAGLLFDQGQNPLAAVLAAGAPTPEKKDRFLIPIRLTMPMANLTLLPQGESRVGALKVRLILRDAASRMTPLREVEVPLRVAEAEAEAALAKQFSYEIRMAVAPGAHRISLGVEDVPTGTQSFVSLNFEVPGK